MMVKVVVSCVLLAGASAMNAHGGEALAALDGAAPRTTRLDAAKARPYKGGFSPDGGEVVCTVPEDPG
ncbi:MAG: hypothetical protein IJI73_07630, partial [Kiritimatiellae bacterium]|nr:hypothetical protein [Kiritimatiellia bacterium]